MSNSNTNTTTSAACAAKKTSIGGQALIEGIMMRGPAVTAMAVRNPEGEIVLEKEQTAGKKAPKIFRLPLLRGIYGMISSFTMGYKYLMRSAEIAGLEEVDDGKKKEKPASEEASSADTTAEKAADTKKSESEESTGISKTLLNIVMIVGSVLGVLLAVGLFIYLPKLLFNFVINGFFGIEKPDVTAPYGERYLYQMLVSAFTGILKIIIFVGYMALVSLMKDIKRTFMYHGAEHKTIFCYEQGLPLTVENIRKQCRFHPRCGTSFMIVMLLISIIIGFFVPICADWLYVLIKLLLVPFAVGIGYEFIKFAGRHDSLIVRILSAPGLWMQRISTKEPTDDMIECAIAAMNEVIPNDGSDNW